MDETISRFPGGLNAPEEWLDLLQPKLPNIPPDMIKHEVLGVTRDFCKRSGVWRDWLHPFNVSGLVHEYNLDTGNPDTEVVNVLEVVRHDNGFPITPMPPELAKPIELIKRTGKPEFYWQTQPDRMFFEPCPIAGDFVKVSVFVNLAPLDLCGMPEWMLSEHQYAIVDGVLGNLLMVGGPNYRPTDARVHKAQYVAARGRARTRAIAGYNRSQARMTPPFFARGSQR